MTCDLSLAWVRGSTPIGKPFPRRNQEPPSERHDTVWRLSLSVRDTASTSIWQAMRSRAPYTAVRDGRDNDSRGATVGERRLVDAGDVVEVGPTPLMRALIGLAVGLAVGALLALLIPRRGVRRL